MFLYSPPSGVGNAVASIPVITATGGSSTMSFSNISPTGPPAPGHVGISPAAQVGDLLVLLVSALNADKSITPPGWDVVSNRAGQLNIYSKVCAAGDPGSTVNVNWTAVPGGWVLCSRVYRGVVGTPAITALAATDFGAVTSVPAPALAFDGTATILDAWAPYHHTPSPAGYGPLPTVLSDPVRDGADTIDASLESGNTIGDTDSPAITYTLTATPDFGGVSSIAIQG